MVTTPRTSRLSEQTLGSAKLREALVGYAFVLLPMAVFGIWYLYPLAYAVYISFFDWGVLGKIESVGTANYQELFEDEFFWRALKNTLLYTAAVVPLQMALGLTMALVVNQPIRGRAFFRSAYYFPALTSSAAISARRALGTPPTFRIAVAGEYESTACSAAR